MEELFRQHYPARKSYLYRMAASEQDAEDLAFETFLRVVNKRCTRRGSSSSGLSNYGRLFRVRTEASLGRRFPALPSHAGHPADHRVPAVARAPCAERGAVPGCAYVHLQRSASVT